LHERPIEQGSHEPPQSTSVSVPLLRPSSQVGAEAQTLLVHSWLEQSLASLHARPGWQTPQRSPQSTSDSSGSITPFMQWAGRLA
jgi:hypothetical protein